MSSFEGSINTFAPCRVTFVREQVRTGVVTQVAAYAIGCCGLLSAEPNDNGPFHQASKPIVLREEPPRAFRVEDPTSVHNIGLELGSRRKERITQLAFFGVLLRIIALRAIY